MIRLVEALNYRCLRRIHQPLSPFHVLVGPNASGKSTFLDVIGLLGDLVTGGVEKVQDNRSANFRDLVWGREGTSFELAIEAEIPEGLQLAIKAEIPEGLRGELSRPASLVRYEVGLELDEKKNSARICHEQVSLGVFGEQPDRRSVIPTGESKWPADRFQGRFSVLGILPSPPYEMKSLITVWLEDILTSGIQRIALDSRAMSRPSPPGKGRQFVPDGSNLPWVVENLKNANKDLFDQWLAHVRTALPDLVDVEIIDRPEDRHRYMMLCYEGGLKVPSWGASDGTLRLLALTLPAYLPGFRGILLVEEPENGIHPKVIETVYQSLSSIYEAQVLLATHSPVVLGNARLEDILCFTKSEDGATNILRGDQHPVLSRWKGEVGLGTLYAAGVLG